MSTSSDLKGLGPPGGSVYTSKTMHVGDGTWDAATQTFLLPNIQGLNFATMRYNGMGNRFSALPEYSQLITAHGIIAAITFLGIVPISILIASFYYPSPRLALRLHITLMILTVFLATVVLVIGYFAVGPERSLTNPHHGIGVAIYVLVLIQVIGGALIHRIEKGRQRYHIPIKMMLHEWVGRAIALLAIAQVPIGLTLYGSPIALFVLYALLVAFYVFLYFTLSYQRKKRAGTGYDEAGSYLSGTRTDLSHRRSGSHHHSRLGEVAAAVGAGGALEALRRRRADRDRRVDGQGSAVDSRADSASYVTEKYSDDSRDHRDHTWGTRFLEGIAGVGAVAGVKKFMDRRRDRARGVHHQSEASGYTDNYGPPRPPPVGPLGGHHSQSTAHVNMMEEGFPGAHSNPQYRNMGYSGPPGPAPLSAPDPEAGMARATIPHRPADDSVVTSSDMTHEHEPQGPMSRIAEAFGFSEYYRRRRARKEQERIDRERQRDYENERLYGRHEQEPLYPGDGSPRRDGVRFDPRTTSDGPDPRPFNQPPIAPVPAPGTSGYGYDPPAPPVQNIPPPPRGGPPGSRGATTGPPPPSGGTFGAADTSQRGPSTRDDINNAARSGPPRDTVLQQPPPVASPGRDRSSPSVSNGNVASPPVSLRLQMHNDRSGNVTLRRLNQEEAAANRASSQDRSRFGGAGGMGPSTGPGGRLQSTPPIRGTPPTAMGQQPVDLHLPPSSSQQQRPYTSSPSAAGGPVGSPLGAGGYDTTDSYETNRRRRRAERARAEQARQAAPDESRVDFS